MSELAGSKISLEPEEDERRALIRQIVGHRTYRMFLPMVILGVVLPRVALGLVEVTGLEERSFFKYLFIVVLLAGAFCMIIAVHRLITRYWFERPLQKLTLAELEAQLPAPSPVTISSSMRITEWQLNRLGADVMRVELQAVKRQYPKHYHDVVTAYANAFKSRKTRASLEKFANEYFTGVPEENL